MEKQCPKKALKVALSVSFLLTAVATYLLPEWGHYVLAAGAGQNLIWLWEC